MMKKLTNKAYSIPMAVSLLLMTALIPMKAMAWGDSSGDGRPSYTFEEVSQGVLGDTIIFNTISDGAALGGYGGDEKNFVSAQKSSDDPKGIWQGNSINVEDGQCYTVRLYAHNNNPDGYDAVSENTHVCFSIQQGSAEEREVNGFISSSNAMPDKYWDDIQFTGDGNKFHLEYIYGSAFLYNNGMAKGGIKLSDEIVTKATQGGVLIGYDALDGKIPGGYQYDSYITIQVKAVFDYEFMADMKVRVTGSDEWGDSVNAKLGDTVEFQIEYKNTSAVNETQKNVMIKDILPDNLQYVAGSTKLWNDNFNGAVLTPDGDIIGRGVNIGDYKAGANAYIRFRAVVMDENLANGQNSLVNWVKVAVGSAADLRYAAVDVQKDKYLIAAAAILIVSVMICLTVAIRSIQKLRILK